MSSDSKYSLAFIGFGEAAAAFSGSMTRKNLNSIVGFDVKTRSDESSIFQKKSEEYAHFSVHECDNLESAIKDADWIISVVTADQAYCAAKTASVSLKEGAYYFDFNSCSPNTKKASSELIEKRGGIYIDVAVMAPVYPLENKVPLLLSGCHAQEGFNYLRMLGLEPEIVNDDVGTASSIKMIRSIMIKGMEALTIECVLAGRRAGVDEYVLQSLDASCPGFDWKTKASYVMERVTCHGKRRSAEMKEVNMFLHELGFEDTMSEITVILQKRMGSLKIKIDSDEHYQDSADKILSKMCL